MKLETSIYVGTLKIYLDRWQYVFLELAYDVATGIIKANEVKCPVDSYGYPKSYRLRVLPY